MRFRIREVYVEEPARDLPLTRRVLERLDAATSVEIVADARDVIARFRKTTPDIAGGKRRLVLQRFRADAVKPCPATPEYLCCQYQILNVAVGCPLDCTYCILQDYFSNPVMVVQADLEALLDDAARHLRTSPRLFHRLGTGEFADSLALDHLTDAARRFVAFAAEQDKAVLELKTKTTDIEHLLNLDHRGRTIVAWSLNTRRIADSEELHAPAVERRLAAAARCAAAGYRVAFHFDPLVHYPGWREEYVSAARAIFEHVRPQDIAWISLGCLRFPPGLEHVMRRRFPRSRLAVGEFIRGGDGKMRYPQPLRVRMYRPVVSALRKAIGNRSGPAIYFCMENPAVWRAVMGEAPDSNEAIGAMLDAAAVRARP